MKVRCDAGANQAGAPATGRRRDVNVGSSVPSSAMGGHRTMHAFNGPLTGTFTAYLHRGPFSQGL